MFSKHFESIDQSASMADFLFKLIKESKMMEINENTIHVSAAEIATVRNRQLIEARIVKALRDKGVLIDPSDMRSPITIAELCGVLIVHESEL